MKTAGRDGRGTGQHGRRHVADQAGDMEQRRHRKPAFACAHAAHLAVDLRREHDVGVGAHRTLGRPGGVRRAGQISQVRWQQIDRRRLFATMALHKLEQVAVALAALASGVAKDAWVIARLQVELGRGVDAPQPAAVPGRSQLAGHRLKTDGHAGATVDEHFGNLAPTVRRVDGYGYGAQLPGRDDDDEILRYVLQHQGDRLVLAQAVRRQRRSQCVGHRVHFAEGRCAIKTMHQGRIRMRLGRAAKCRQQGWRFGCHGIACHLVLGHTVSCAYVGFMMVAQHQRRRRSHSGHGCWPAMPKSDTALSQNTRADAQRLPCHVRVAAVTDKRPEPFTPQLQSPQDRVPKETRP